MRTHECCANSSKVYVVYVHAWFTGINYIINWAWRKIVPLFLRPYGNQAWCIKITSISRTRGFSIRHSKFQQSQRLDFKRYFFLDTLYTVSYINKLDRVKWWSYELIQLHMTNDELMSKPFSSKCTRLRPINADIKFSIGWVFTMNIIWYHVSWTFFTLVRLCHCMNNVYVNKPRE